MKCNIAAVNNKFTVFFIVLAFFMFSTARLNAQERVEIVRKGDSLWRMCERALGINARACPGSSFAENKIVKKCVKAVIQANALDVNDVYGRPNHTCSTDKRVADGLPDPMRLTAGMEMKMPYFSSEENSELTEAQIRMAIRQHAEKVTNLIKRQGYSTFVFIVDVSGSMQQSEVAILIEEITRYGFSKTNKCTGVVYDPDILGAVPLQSCESFVPQYKALLQRHTDSPPGQGLLTMLSSLITNWISMMLMPEEACRTAGGISGLERTNYVLFDQLTNLESRNVQSPLFILFTDEPPADKECAPILFNGVTGAKPALEIYTSRDAGQEQSVPEFLGTNPDTINETFSNIGKLFIREDFIGFTH